MTSFRIIAIPFIVLAMTRSHFEWAFFLALISALSDFLDGKIARALNQESQLGALLDPIADKLFEMTLTLFFYFQGLLPAYYVGLLWIRNWAQLMSIPILMGWLKIEFKVRPSWQAKWGSAIGMVIICLIIFLLMLGKHEIELEILWIVLPKLLIPISAGFEIYMLVTYLPRFYQIAKGKHDTFN